MAPKIILVKIQEMSQLGAALDVKLGGGLTAEVSERCDQVGI